MAACPWSLFHCWQATLCLLSAAFCADFHAAEAGLVAGTQQLDGLMT